MATPFDKDVTATLTPKKVEKTTDVLAPTEVPVKTKPTLRVFNWIGQRCEVGAAETRIWPPWQEGVDDAPYPYEFTFLQGAVLSPFGAPVSLNPLQYASIPTAERVFNAMRQLLPDVLLQRQILTFASSSPYQTSIPQAVIYIPGLDPWNAGAIATMIMQNGWQYFVQWAKQTLEPQGLRVLTDVSDAKLLTSGE